MLDKQYSTFEQWFYEIESFSTRAERFYEVLEMYRCGTVSDESMVSWLRAAFDSARGSQ